MISTMVANLELSIKTIRPNSTNLQLAALTVADILLMILIVEEGFNENFFWYGASTSRGLYTEGEARGVLVLCAEGHKP